MGVGGASGSGAGDAQAVKKTAASAANKKRDRMENA